MAWLQEAALHEHKESHQDEFILDFDRRRDARAELHAIPGSDILFAQERPRREVGGALEGSEPEGAP